MALHMVSLGACSMCTQEECSAGDEQNDLYVSVWATRITVLPESFYFLVEFLPSSV